jgi:hypothetical protein
MSLQRNVEVEPLWDSIWDREISNFLNEVPQTDFADVLKNPDISPLSRWMFIIASYNGALYVLSTLSEEMVTIVAEEVESLVETDESRYSGRLWMQRAILEFISDSKVLMR